MKAYSHDVHKRVLRAVDRGYPRTEIVQLFGVSRSPIKLYDPRNGGRTVMCRPKRPGRSPKKRTQVEKSVLPH